MYSTTSKTLTFKAPTITAADILKYSFIIIIRHGFSEKISSYISCETSSKQKIHMKRKVLFSLTINKKKKKKNTHIGIVVCCNNCLRLQSHSC